MPQLDKEAVGFGLQLVSTLGTGIFAGGAFYINAVEHPARMEADMSTAVTAWKPSFLRAAALQSKLAAFSGLAAIGSYLCLRGTSKEDMYWVEAGGLMLSVFPITLAFIRPINNQLLETEKSIEKGDSSMQEMLSSWNKFHGIRTAASLFAFGLMVYRLTKA